MVILKFILWSFTVIGIIVVLAIINRLNDIVRINEKLKSQCYLITTDYVLPTYILKTEDSYIEITNMVHIGSYACSDGTVHAEEVLFKFHQ